MITAAVWTSGSGSGCGKAIRRHLGRRNRAPLSAASVSGWGRGSAAATVCGSPRGSAPAAVWSDAFIAGCRVGTRGLRHRHGFGRALRPLGLRHLSAAVEEDRRRQGSANRREVLQRRQSGPPRPPTAAWRTFCRSCRPKRGSIRGERRPGQSRRSARRYPDRRHAYGKRFANSWQHRPASCP